MSCVQWEERVALFAGGDLRPAEAAAVECHLSECAACAALAADLECGLRDLRRAHAEPIPAAYYIAVRARVIAKLAQGTRAHGWLPVWVAAVAAGAFAVLLGMLRPAAVLSPETARVVAEVPQRLGTSASAGRPLAHPNRPPLCRAGAIACRPLPQPRAPALDLAALPSIRAQELVRAEVASLVPPEDRIHVVRIATDDPNVVIYWQIDDTGESGGE